MADELKRFVYIGRYNLDRHTVKVGITNDLDRRLHEYNHTTGVSSGNEFSYLYTAKVADARTIENAIKKELAHFREDESREIYFYNQAFFNLCIKTIESHLFFEKRLEIKETKNIIKVFKKDQPTLKERGITSQRVMLKAKKKKDDEFYTRYEDVEKEMACYPEETFLDKVVFCNCDDPVSDDKRKASAFSIYFLENFKRLGLKKLICTHYSEGADLFDAGNKGYVFTKDGCEPIGWDLNKGKTYKGNGDYASDECIKILNEEADIVVTNPPFSLMIDYMTRLIKSKKNFIILGNVVYPVNPFYIDLFMLGVIKSGYNEVDEFENPKRQTVRAAAFWYTNVPILNRPRHRLLKIVSLDNIPEKYRRYDDNGVLLVDNSFVPNDYNGSFAVSARTIHNGILEKGYRIVDRKSHQPKINGKIGFARVLIQKI